MSRQQQLSQPRYSEESFGQQQNNTFEEQQQEYEFDIDIDNLIKNDQSSEMYQQRDSNERSQGDSLNQQCIFRKIHEIQKRFDRRNLQKNQSNYPLYPPVPKLFLCMKEVYSQFSEEKVDNAIHFIHNLFHRQSCPAATVQQHKMENKRPADAQYEEQNTNMITFKNHLRDDEEAKIAKSYVEFGYGIRVLRQQLGDQHMTTNRYNNLITIIIKNTFRSIESILSQTTKQMRQVGGNQERILRSPLINCSKWLPPDQYKTFIEFVKGTYGLSKAHVHLQDVSNLYDSIMIQLKQREMQQILTRQPRASAPIKFKKQKTARPLYE